MPLGELALNETFAGGFVGGSERKANIPPCTRLQRKNHTGLSVGAWQPRTSFRQVQRVTVAFQIHQACADSQYSINLARPSKNSRSPESFAMPKLASPQIQHWLLQAYRQGTLCILC